jgi:hypothetical protein
MKSHILVPAVARFSKDLATSSALADELTAKTGHPSGLMLVQLGGRSAVVGEKAEAQIKNLAPYANRMAESPVVVMLSNMPIGEIDFLNNTSAAIEHATDGIRFAASLPGPRRIVTCHLNSLVAKEEFESSSIQQWQQTFENIVMPALSTVGSFAKKYDVEFKIETVPVPEFCDSVNVGKTDQLYRGVPLRDLRNPFYLTHQWGFNLLPEVNVGICLDLCHNRTIYASARFEMETGHANGLLPSDAAVYSKRSLIEDVRWLDNSDMVHLNDGSGLFIGGDVGYNEGVPLGDGDITDLPEIIEILSDKGILSVLEADEAGDFVNRPGSKKSIDYLVRHGL